MRPKQGQVLGPYNQERLGLARWRPCSNDCVKGAECVVGGDPSIWGGRQLSLRGGVGVAALRGTSTRGAVQVCGVGLLTLEAAQGLLSVPLKQESEEPAFWGVGSPEPRRSRGW